MQVAPAEIDVYKRQSTNSQFHASCQNAPLKDRIAALSMEFLRFHLSLIHILIPVEKVRGRKNSLDALVNHMAKTVEHPEEQVIFISHGNAPKDAEYVAEQVKSRFAVQNIYILSLIHIYFSGGRRN